MNHSLIVSKKNIPLGGDIVDNIKYTKDRTAALILFDSGKKVYIKLDPSEFGKKQVVKEDVVINNNKSDKQEINHPILQNENDYKLKAMETLARLTGTPIEELQNQAQQNQTMQQISNPIIQENKTEITMTSEERSRKLAEEYSISQGGKLESSFGGKDSIEL